MKSDPAAKAFRRTGLEKFRLLDDNLSDGTIAGDIHILNRYLNERVLVVILR